MAMTERSRAALYQGLSTVVDEEAVGEMLSYFPARDIDEPASRDLVERRFAEAQTTMARRFGAVETRIAQLETTMEQRFGAVDTRFARLETTMEQRFGEATAETQRVRNEVLQVRGEVLKVQADLHHHLRLIIQWNVGTVIAVLGLLVALRIID